MPVIDTPPSGAQAVPSDAPWARVRALPWPRWRVSTWLLAGWCLTATLWWLSRSTGLRRCPKGIGDCVREAEFTGFGGRYALGLVVVTVALAVLWAWDRRRAGAHEESAVTEASGAGLHEGIDEPTAFGAVRATRHPWRLAVVSTLGTLAIAISVLTAPPPTVPVCGAPIALNGSMGFVLNCDSPLFMDLANDPGSLFTPGNARQSRPVYVYVSAALTTVLAPVGDALHIGETFGQADRAWFPLILINFFGAAAAVAILAWITRRLGGSDWLAAALGVLLVANGLTKAFIWTPHQQMFALLVPVVSIAVGRWIWLKQPSVGKVALLGLGFGVASLMYGSFLVTVPVLGLVLLVTRGLRAAVVPGLALGAAFAAPNVAWIEICKAKAGSYYNNELERYDQFVWIPKSAKEGLRPFFDYAETMGVSTIRNTIHLGLYAIAAIVALTVVAVILRSRLRPETPEQRAILGSTLITVAATVAFVFGIGFNVERIAFHVMPALLVLVAWLATRVAISPNQRPARPLTYAIVGLAALATTIEVLTSHGPYT